MLGVTAALIEGSWPSIKRFGLSFLWGSTWDINKGIYGALSPTIGTVATTLIAMVIALPLALVIALLLVELLHPIPSRIIGTAIEMLAAIPSIIYGMWGIFVLVPIMQSHVIPWLQATPLGDIPWLLQGPPMGIGLLTAGLILSFMVLPFITAVSRDVLRMVPTITKEAGYGMGATTWEVTRKISFRYGFGGFVGAFFIGLGRAFGETMAVTYVIGNEFRLPKSLVDPGVTFASGIAAQFPEAQGLHRASLMELGLMLFLVTIIFQIIAQLWLRRVNKKVGIR
jgi:phosphate transport system permease protein